MDIVVTADGSRTLYHAAVGENYHSKHGAEQESKHVFLKSGLQFFLTKDKVSKAAILEVGFGTGLNFILTAEYCMAHNIQLDYCGIEAYPLPLETISQLQYSDLVPENIGLDFQNAYPKALLQETVVNPNIQLQVAHTLVMGFNSSKQFDVIYFDAFAAVHQPEMWSEETLTHVTKFLKPGGVFVTYAITGNLKRAMKALGFTIEKAPGAPGKREMLRAIKL